MLKLAVVLLSTTFLFSFAQAKSTMYRNGICHHADKDFMLYSETRAGIEMNKTYVIVQKDAAPHSNLPLMTEAKPVKAPPILNFLRCGSLC